MAALEFLARWADHVPERYEVRVRFAGAFATRRRVSRRRTREGEPPRTSGHRQATAEGRVRARGRKAGIGG